MTTWAAIELLWSMHGLFCMYNIAFTRGYSVLIMQCNFETSSNKSTQYIWQYIVTMYSIFSPEPGNTNTYGQMHMGIQWWKGTFSQGIVKGALTCNPYPSPASPYSSSSPLRVALPQTCISVRWPCFNVCWKGRSGPVHWFRKALLGLYAWLRFSVIPPDTGDIHCLHHWHPAHTHTHTHKQKKQKQQNTKSKAIARLSGCQTSPLGDFNLFEIILTQ